MSEAEDKVKRENIQAESDMAKKNRNGNDEGDAEVALVAIAIAKRLYLRDPGQ